MPFKNLLFKAYGVTGCRVRRRVGLQPCCGGFYDCEYIALTLVRLGQYNMINLLGLLIFGLLLTVL